jgi:hypothetical protein
MAQQDDRFTRVIAAIDAANARDPNMTDAGGKSQPAELVYGQRMTGTLMRIARTPRSHCGLRYEVSISNAGNCPAPAIRRGGPVTCNGGVSSAITRRRGSAR